MQELNNASVRDQLLERGIEWRFNPPQASHMGGVWERQIRTVRRVLAGFTLEQLMTDESLLTMMTVEEGIVNNWPMTATSTNPKDLEALTPNHLLLMRLAAMPPGLCNDADRHRRTWEQVRYLANIFWRRWTREYLPLLRSRTKWTAPQRTVAEGDVVLLIDYTQPHGEWQLGRVVKA